MKKTVVFDFDGVIHSYTSGWQGVTEINDPPVEGIAEAIAEIREAGFEVVIVSTRCDDPAGVAAIRRYLEKNGIEVDAITAHKPPAICYIDDRAICYIDDRAICFDGNAGALLGKILDFKPWNKKGEK